MKKSLLQLNRRIKANHTIQFLGSRNDKVLASKDDSSSGFVSLCIVYTQQIYRIIDQSIAMHLCKNLHKLSRSNYHGKHVTYIPGSVNGENRLYGATIDHATK